MRALPLAEESSLRTDVVQPSARFGRLLRQDPPLQLGVPTQDLALLALRRGQRADAVSLAKYMVDEYRIVHDTVLNGWLRQLIEYAVPRLEAQRFAPALTVPRTHAWDAFLAVGVGFNAEAVAAIESGDVAHADLLLDHVRRIFKTINDETVRFIQDILNALALAYDEDEPIRAQRGPYETIWRKRYALWDTLTPEEQLQLTCEGMRTHYGGPTRHGEFDVYDDGDRYRMVFSPCGTGGILRRGDPETGTPPWEGFASGQGVNRVAQPYTWHQEGVPWYCTHCNLYLEHWAAEDVGRPIRPVLFHPGADGPSTSWLIYKRPDLTRADDYERIGLAPPPGAPRK